jgi:anti-sigma factor RsiW
MNCRELNEFLIDYLDNELPTETRREFEHHIDICAPCLAFLESYRKAAEIGKLVFDHPEDPVPLEVPERLVQAVLRSRAHEVEDK